MAKLIFTAITSLDGYIADAGDNFDWARPDREVSRFINDLEAPMGTYLYGRRMYETMVYWETAQSLVDLDSESQEFGEIWRAAQKIVYSRSLAVASSARTQIERVFDATVIQVNRPGNSGGSPAWERGWNHGKEANWVQEVSV